LSNPTLPTAAHLWVSSSIRGTATGIKHSGAPRGAVLSATVLPAVALMTTWRWALGFTCGNCSECVDYCPGGAITGRC
jgi:ferredoxin